MPSILAGSDRQDAISVMFTSYPSFLRNSCNKGGFSPKNLYKQDRHLLLNALLQGKLIKVIKDYI